MFASTSLAGVRSFLVGASAVTVFVMLACSSSTSTGSGTSTFDGSVSSGGTAASGGGTSAGGAVGTGATSGTGGGGVSPGKATIEFTVVGPDSYCAMSACDGPSVGIKDSSGKPLALTMICTQVPCDRCQPSGCPGYACQVGGIAVTGAKLEWDGSHTVTSTCGAGTSCVEYTYAPPGRYTATMCATPGKLTGPDGGQQQCVNAGPLKCSSIDFDFPSITVVKGTVGP